VWQVRFPQLAFSVEARKLIRFNKSENAKAMWKSIFASCHSGSEGAAEKVSYFVIPNEVRNLSWF
jgi:hypothetical protein